MYVYQKIDVAFGILTFISSNATNYCPLMKTSVIIARFLSLKTSPIPGNLIYLQRLLLLQEIHNRIFRPVQDSRLLPTHSTQIQISYQYHNTFLRYLSIA